MSRSGYSDDCDGWQLIMWRGAVAKGINGKRGQAFLKEMLCAMDAMPVKKLIEGDLVTPGGEVCAIGTIMAARGIDASHIDVEDSEHIAKLMGVSNALVKEIVYQNDEAWDWGHGITDEKRFERMYKWIKGHIKSD